MRSFRLDVGPGRRLTRAGCVVLSMSTATTASLAFAGGLSRLGPRVIIFGPILAATCGAAAWTAGAVFCRRAGIPLFTPWGHAWDGTQSVPRARSRRPFQFPLWWHHATVLSVAVLCALARPELDRGSLTILAALVGLALGLVTSGREEGVSRQLRDKGTRC
jgi:hypothetical protein